MLTPRTCLLQILVLLIFISCQGQISINQPSNFLNLVSSSIPSSFGLGSAIEIDFSVENLGDMSDLSYTCTYDQSVNQSVGDTSPCSDIVGAVFSQDTGKLEWTPQAGQTGDYEFKITAISGSKVGTKIISFSIIGPAPSDDFISVWRTTTNNESITLPLRSGYNYNFTVDWGDGSPVATVTSAVDANATHSYAVAGDYTVTIKGLLEAWYFNWSGSNSNIIEVVNFGDMGWINLESAFSGCDNLTSFSGGKTSQVTDMSNMFYYTASLTSLDLSGFDTSNVTTMREMFSSSNISSVNLANWNTSNVTNMQEMFAYTFNLTALDLSSFNTANVTTMRKMFASAEAMTTLTLGPNFTTENVTNMAEMFSSCGNLTSLDLSSFNTANVTTMNNMFSGLGVSSLDLSSFDTSNVTDMTTMFYGMSNLTSLNISSFNTSNVTNMAYMFSAVPLLTELDLSHFNTSNVTGVDSMFSGMTGLTKLNLNNWDVDQITFGHYFMIFDGNTATLLCDQPGYIIFEKNCELPDVAPALDAIGNQTIFQGRAITTINAGDGGDDLDANGTALSYSCYFDQTIDGVVDNTFACDTLSGLSFSLMTGVMNWTPTIAQSGGYEFKIIASDGSLTDNKIFTITVSGSFISKWRIGADGETLTLPLRQDDGLGYNFNYNFTVSWGDGSSTTVAAYAPTVSHTYALAGDYTIVISGLAEAWYLNFESAADKLIEVNNLGELGWKNFLYAFAGCSNLTTFNAGVTDTSQVTSMEGMFYFPHLLTSINLSSFNTQAVTNMTEMFYGADALTSLDLSSFNTSNVTTMGSMFAHMSSVETINVSSFNTASVTDMNEMFYENTSLLSLNLNSFTTPSLITMNSMFENDSSLTSLDLSSFDTTNVTSMSDTFAGMNALSSIDVSSFNTANVENMRRLFCYTSLSNLDLQHFNTAKVTDVSSMFEATPLMTNLNLSGWDISLVTSSTDIFTGMPPSALYCDHGTLFGWSCN